MCLGFGCALMLVGFVGCFCSVGWCLRVFVIWVFVVRVSVLNECDWCLLFCG